MKFTEDELYRIAEEEYKHAKFWPAGIEDALEFWASGSESEDYDSEDEAREEIEGYIREDIRAAIDRLEMDYDTCLEVVRASGYYGDLDEIAVWNLVDNDYLTCNNGRNGDKHYWFLDGEYEAVYNDATGEMLSGEEASKYAEEQFC